MVGFELADKAHSAVKAYKYVVTMDFPIVNPLPLPPDSVLLDEVAASLGIARSGILEALSARVDLLLYVDADAFVSVSPDFPRIAKMDFRYIAAPLGL